LRSVVGTPFDFRKPAPIGLRINDPNDEQIRLGHGYDHNFVLNKKANEFSFLARVVEPVTGRTMEVWTTAPGSQFYSANFLDGTLTGKGGRVYLARNGFCFEPQHYPDSPNHPAFPTTELKPGDTYRSTMAYKFGVQ
jgi:aldose 1-epimerase